MILSLYEPFRHWSETGSVYMLSDTHFADEDCALMDPNWIDPDEQVKILNDTVRKTDTLILLGDIGDAEYLHRLNAGKKILIMGNHDRRGEYMSLFNEIYRGALIISEKILLSHEPVSLPWCLNIHGHVHNGEHIWTDEDKDGHICKHINIAANICGYKPVSLSLLIKEGCLADIDSIHRLAIEKAKNNPFSRIV